MIYHNSFTWFCLRALSYAHKLSCIWRLFHLSNTILHTKPSTRLRQLLQGRELIVSSASTSKPLRMTHHAFNSTWQVHMPLWTFALKSTTGVYDGIPARLALEAGSDVLYMSGVATTASMLGQPDLAIAAQNGFIQVHESLWRCTLILTSETEYYYDCRP